MIEAPKRIVVRRKRDGTLLAFWSDFRRWAKTPDPKGQTVYVRDDIADGYREALEGLLRCGPESDVGALCLQAEAALAAGAARMTGESEWAAPETVWIAPHCGLCNAERHEVKWAGGHNPHDDCEACGRPAIEYRATDGARKHWLCDDATC